MPSFLVLILSRRETQNNKQLVFHYTTRASSNLPNRIHIPSRPRTRLTSTAALFPSTLHRSYECNAFVLAIQWGSALRDQVTP